MRPDLTRTTSPRDRMAVVTRSEFSGSSDQAGYGRPRAASPNIAAKPALLKVDLPRPNSTRTYPCGVREIVVARPLQQPAPPPPKPMPPRPGRAPFLDRHADESRPGCGTTPRDGTTMGGTSDQRTDAVHIFGSINQFSNSPQRHAHKNWILAPTCQRDRPESATSWRAPPKSSCHISSRANLSAGPSTKASEGSPEI